MKQSSNNIREFGEPLGDGQPDVADAPFSSTDGLTQSRMSERKFSQETSTNLHDCISERRREVERAALADLPNDEFMRIVTRGDIVDIADVAQKDDLGRSTCEST